MAQAAEQYSDLSIVTSDNPRTEDPQAICEEVIAGFEGRDCEMVVDRKDAIERAIELAQPGDLVLIAGKGHEDYQIFAHSTVEFSDSEVARELCAKKMASMSGC